MPPCGLACQAKEAFVDRDEQGHAPGVSAHFEWGIDVGTSVQADAKFLRRIFMGLVFLTVVTGVMAGVTTVQAMSGSTGVCVVFCE